MPIIKVVAGIVLIAAVFSPLLAAAFGGRVRAWRFRVKQAVKRRHR